MKRFRLQITDKFEDRPRLITAYGRVRGGEVGLVIRPLERRVLVVHITKDTAMVWDSKLGDVPKVPSTSVSSAEAVKLIRTAQRSPGKRGPATFRGQWVGTLVWDDGPPRVELRRKLASYGWLHLKSEGDGWRWMFDRQGKWFTSPAAKDGGPEENLLRAIDAGVAAGLGLVREACAERDTTRKTAQPEPAIPVLRGPKSPSGSKPRRTRKPRTTPSRKKGRSATKPVAPDCACRVNPTVVPASTAKGAAEMPATNVEAASTLAKDELLMQAFARALDQALVA